MAIKKTGMTDLARSPIEIKKSNMPMAIGESSRDKYSYGTSVTLNSEMLQKLGIKELPEVGDEYHIMAVGKVTSVSKNASETNESTRMEIQLTHMKLEHENAAEEAKETPAQEKAEVFGGKGGIRFK